MIAHSTPNENLAWEQNALLVQRIDMASLKGDESVDMLKRKRPSQMGGHENVINPRALPGYIDFLKLKNWFRIETKPVDFYDVAGQTLFPIYGNSGGLISAMVFYLVYEGQVGDVQTREGAFIQASQSPRGCSENDLTSTNAVSDADEPVWIESLRRKSLPAGICAIGEENGRREVRGWLYRLPCASRLSSYRAVLGH